MHYLYYSFAIIAILYEFGNLYSPNKIIEFRKTLKGKKLDEQTPKQRYFVIMLLLYFIWGLFGLFTSQWFLFLTMILFGFLPIKKHKVGVVIDAAVSVILLTFIIINRYHLKLTIFDIINSIKS